MQVVLASMVSAVLFLIGCIHLYWLFGGRKGFSIAIPTRSNTNSPLFKPGRFGVAAVTLIFWAAAVSLLMFVEVFPPIGPSWLPRFAAWSLAVVFLLRAIGECRAVGIFKSIRDTPFARLDSLIYSPLCLLLSGLTFWMLLLA